MPIRRIPLERHGAEFRNEHAKGIGGYPREILIQTKKLINLGKGGSRGHRPTARVDTPPLAGVKK